MSTDVRCVECARLDLREAGREFAVHGLGCCPDDEKWEHRCANFKRSCARFSPAPAEVVQKRTEYLSQP